MPLSPWQQGPSLAAEPSPGGTPPYLILSQVAILQNGQLLLQGLQFLYLPGKGLLIMLPHGIL